MSSVLILIHVEYNNSPELRTLLFHARSPLHLSQSIYCSLQTTHNPPNPASISFLTLVKKLPERYLARQSQPPLPALTVRHIRTTFPRRRRSKCVSNALQFAKEVGQNGLDLSSFSRATGFVAELYGRRLIRLI